ncbi:hypothetical protein GCM10022271_12260 [Corallibacter vietnamensis]|uniref:Uncharacterized protein n=1 Tax=Corallibacter vietnamensis TaxID=904130 RepID=A0ABP7H3Y2_9FLAO
MILRGLFKDDLFYVKIWKNRIEIIDVEKGNSICDKSNISFSNDRLLISDFDIAEKFFKKQVEKLKKDYKVKRYNSFIVQPMELNEGGISEVEKRIFLESFERVNGRKVKIWDGAELTNKEVIDKLRS